MKLMRNFFYLLPGIMILWTGCQSQPAPEILISKIYKPDFHNWLMQADSNLNLTDMYIVSPDSIDYYLKESDGIIISGGPDVNPELYGKGDEIGKCEEIDYRRDTLEIRMIRYAMENKIPLLCICRGEQILNVANGGTLITDIPTDYDTLIIHRGGTSRHLVTIREGTFLSEICQTERDTVNSYHHQAVSMVAPLFRAAAFTEDSLIEAIELADPAGHPFILGLQWHPESMEFDHPLSGPVAIRFTNEIKNKARSN